MDYSKPIRISVETAIENIYRTEPNIDVIRTKEMLLREMGRKIFLSNELIRKTKNEKISASTSRMKYHIYSLIKPVEGLKLSYTAPNGTEIMYSYSEIVAQVPKEKRTYKIDVRQYCLEHGMTICGKNYDDVRQSIESLYSDASWLPKFNEENDKNQRIYKGWIDAPIDNGDGTFDVTISEELVPFLYLDTNKGNFSAVDRWDFEQFKNSHSAELYVFLKSFENLPKMPVRTPIDQLQEVLGVNYTDTSMFIKRCITNCVIEINQYTDIYVRQAVPVKTGNKITHIDFDIITKDKGTVEAMKSRLIDQYYEKNYAPKKRSRKKRTPTEST